jgi:hypothetical protein
MAQWKFVTQARNGSPIADLAPALTQRRLTFQLNRPPVISASIPVSSPLAKRDEDGGLQPGVHELKLYRDGETVETVYQLVRSSVSADQNTMRLDLEWHGIASYLQDALVFDSTTAYSSTTLPWTWINTFQSRTGGGYGITQGPVIGTAPTRQKTVTQYAGLLDTIIELSESGDGFDWSIDTNRTYREWHPTRGSDNGLLLEYGSNVAAFSFTESTAPGEIVTDVYVQGPPGSQEVTASNSTSRTTYGRREASLTFFADFEASTVTNGQIQKHADAAIAERIAPIVIPQITLMRESSTAPWGSYWLGDTVTFRADVGAYQKINAEYRIVQIDVELDDNDNETISLGLNAA